MESVIEQLRVQDGKIFQNEMVLTLYTDVKRLVLDNIFLAISTNSLSTLLAWGPELEDHMVRSLTCHNPEEMLNQIVEIHAKLLYNVPVNLKRIKLGTLLKGLFQRLVNDSTVKNNQIQMLDPIKQDFVCREAFRRTLASDCMQFETTETVTIVQTVPAENVPVQAVPIVQNIPTVPDNKTVMTERTERRTIIPDLVSIREEPIVSPDDSISQVVRENQTVVSMASTMTGRIHKPTNFRRIILDDEKTILTRN